jgi:hypothetical protein
MLLLLVRCEGPSQDKLLLLFMNQIQDGVAQAAPPHAQPRRPMPKVEEGKGRICEKK